VTEAFMFCAIDLKALVSTKASKSLMIAVATSASRNAELDRRSARPDGFTISVVGVLTAFDGRVHQ
jgi:hypothetical protein